ncbi:hypothetical protein C2845_PM15G09100 [Panicum miliaceum]|uniref:Uncharacterized protein n=1 Tax=Panicum miliaceum TaxID=4540 RepID=A0A3L6Q656_PANMI|nr:hypothetical protein C2845_PM15G09100 [Panicum miliaceum]
MVEEIGMPWRRKPAAVELNEVSEGTNGSHYILGTTIKTTYGLCTKCSSQTYNSMKLSSLSMN